MSSSEEIQPVFLIGAGRSGTKFLRGVLTASRSVVSVPYDVGYVWRYGNESLPHDELKPSMLTPRIKAYIRKTLPRLVEHKEGGLPKIFLEKSVPNSLRPEFLDAIFPNAKFIHLIRDGRAVTESSVRMWNEPPEKGYLLKKFKYFPWSNYRYAFWYLSNMIKGIIGGRGQKVWGPRYSGIDRDTESLDVTQVCAKQWRKCVETSLQGLSLLDSSRVIEVRYESLMKDESELVRICQFLELDYAEIVIDYFKNTFSASNVNKWKDRMDEETLNTVNQEIAGLLGELGYE